MNNGCFICFLKEISCYTQKMFLMRELVYFRGSFQKGRLLWSNSRACKLQEGNDTVPADSTSSC